MTAKDQRTLGSQVTHGADFPACSGCFLSTTLCEGKKTVLVRDAGGGGALLLQQLSLYPDLYTWLGLLLGIEETGRDCLERKNFKTTTVMN